MISREEAEKILGKPSPKHPIFDRKRSIPNDWLKHVPILHYPEIASKVLTEKALFVVHPSSDYLFYIEKEIIEPLPKYYINYMEKLTAEIRSVLGKKSVLVWTSVSYLNPIIRYLGVDRNSVIWVPTKNGEGKLEEDILRMEENQFYQVLSGYVKRADLTGELADHCVSDVEDSCKGKINTHRVKNLIYG